MNERVAVIGLGALGTAAAWRLAAAGAEVVGFEAHTAGHDRGSSHGATRLMRRVCLEHPGLVALAERSSALLRELEASTGERLFDETGGVTIGMPHAPIVRETLRVARATRAAHTVLDTDAVRALVPAMAIEAGAIGVVDPHAGVIRAEASVLAAWRAARDAGAVLLERTPVVGIREERDGVVVETAHGHERVDRVVVTTGAWLGRFAPALPLTPVRTLVTWFDGADGALAPGIDALPVVVAETAAGAFWGHGAVDAASGRAKLGPVDDPAFVPVDPDALVGSVVDGDGARIAHIAAAVLPTLEPHPASMTPCMYTRTPDGLFVLGAVRERVLVAGGCNGHAFKHATGIGDALADLALGRAPSVDVGFLDPHRCKVAT